MTLLGLLRRAPILLLAAAVYPASAQSVQPAIIEYTGQASGSFQVTNDLPVPIFVSVEAQSFTIDPNGKAIYRPLDPSIHVNLSTTSLKLPPKQSRTVYYKASADQFPAWFTLYSTLMGLPGRQGVTVQLRLPHTVYLLPKTKASRASIELRHPAQVRGTLEGEVANVGSDFTRATEVDVMTAKGKKLTFGGFPLLPHSVRALALPLDGAEAARVSVKFKDFTVDQPISQTLAAAAPLPAAAVVR